MLRTLSVNSYSIRKLLYNKMSLPGYLALAIFVAIGSVSCEPVYVEVEVEQGMLRGETIDFVEDEFINIDTQINVFKVKFVFLLFLCDFVMFSVLSKKLNF